MVSGGREVMAARTRTAGRHVIVTIGIDRYRHWRPLHNAVSDAKGATDLFKQLGFEEVVPPLLDEQATSTAMRALVSDVLARCLDREDSLVLFYAGHGGTRSQQCGEHDVRTGYLIPVDGFDEGDRFMSWIELEPWLRRVSKLPPKHILVILDACETGIALAGAVNWGRNTGSFGQQPFGAANQKMSRLLITSASEGEVAMDNGPRDGHSLFTGCLLEALTGGDVRHHAHGGRLNTIGSELGHYVRYCVQSYSGRAGSVQTPNVGRFDRDRQGEMLIPLLVEPATSEHTRAPSASESVELRPSQSIMETARPLTHAGASRRWRAPALRSLRPVAAMLVCLGLAGLAYSEGCGVPADSTWTPRALVRLDASVEAAPTSDAAGAAPTEIAVTPGPAGTPLAEAAAPRNVAPAVAMRAPMAPARSVALRRATPAAGAPPSSAPRMEREDAPPPVEHGKRGVASSVCPTEIRANKAARVTWNSATKVVPAILDLPCGVEVSLLLQKDHFRAVTRLVTATRDKTWLGVRLYKKYARVSISSTPSGADIHAGAQRATTPTTIQLPEGEAVTVTLTKQGYEDGLQKLFPTEGRRVHLTLTKLASGSTGPR